MELLKPISLAGSPCDAAAYRARLLTEAAAACAGLDRDPHCDWHVPAAVVNKVRPDGGFKPYFGDTLTFICEHNDEGAMGIMVNRPSHVSLIELMAQLGIDKGSTPVDALVLEGGPVEVERGFILHTTDERFEASLDLGCGISLSSAREVLEAIAAGNGPEHYLVALGYAGWDAGQLESEVADNA